MLEFITKPVTDITAILIKWLYDILAAHGIKSMIITIIALAFFSRLLGFLTKQTARILSKFIKSQILLKILNGLSIAISIFLGLGVFFVMQNIGTYIPELKNSMFLTKTPFNLYSQDKTKLIYYIGFLAIEIFYFVFNNVIIPKLLKTKPNFKLKLLQIYTTCVICVTGFFALPVGILIYWAMTSIISMIINSITIAWRMFMRKKYPEKYKKKQQAIQQKSKEKGFLDKMLEGLTAKQNEVRKERGKDSINIVPKESKEDNDNVYLHDVLENNK